MDLQTSALALRCSLVAWDSDAAGYPVAQIDELRVTDPVAAVADFKAFESWRDSNGVRLVSHRCDRGHVREWMFLEGRAFRFVEMVHHPVFEAVQAVDYPDHELTIVVAGANDLPALEAIARSAFTTGRFALDPRVDPELSGRRYAAWVRRALTHPTQRLLKISRTGDILAFFIVERTDGDRCRWHLTAVAPRHQGRGVGRAVWQAMLMHHKADGVVAVDTVVSAHNLPVLDLYSTLGFRLRKAEVTLHWMPPR